MDIFSYLLGKKASGGGGGTGRDWSTLGYSGEPKSITDGYNYAKQIYDNWDATKTDYQSKYKNNYDLVYFPKVDLSNATTLAYMFDTCRRLEYFPPNMDIHNVTSLAGMFQGCGCLREINIDTSHATNVNSMFSICTCLKKVGDLDLTNAENCGSIFSNCQSLTTIGTIKPPTKTLNTLLGESMFASCAKIVDAPNFDTSKFTSLRGMFTGCTGLKNVPVYDFSGIKQPSSTSSYSNSPIYMFSNCKYLTNESLNNIMASALTATNITSSTFKTLKALGFSSAQANICITLSNWSDLEEAGWTTGF